MQETNNSHSTSKYLTAGIIAGPFFILLALVQAFTREGFDWVRHPASMLSLGDAICIKFVRFVAVHKEENQCKKKQTLT